MLPRAFFAEIAKVAFDPEAASRVLQLAKSKALSKGVGRALNAEGAEGIAGFATKASLKKSRADIRHFAGQLTNPQLKDAFAGQAEATKNVPGVLGAVLKKHPKGAFLRSGGASSLLKKHVPGRSVAGIELSPEHKKIVNAITAGHEIDEMGARHLGRSFLGHGHRSPAVILREHNRVATLPPEHAPVRAFMQAIRNHSAAGEGAVLKQHGIEYGAPGTRLNRHKVKALSTQWNAAADHETVDALNSMR